MKKCELLARIFCKEVFVRYNEGITSLIIFMLNLYIKSGCPYCLRVIEANKTIGAPLTVLNISANHQLRDELMEKGGMTQAPFLEDAGRGVSMYESLDIISYLNEYYNDGKEVTISTVANVCPID